MSEVSVSAQEQHKTISQVGEGIDQIGSVSRNQASASEETAAAEELAAQAATLQQIANELDLLVAGSR